MTTYKATARCAVCGKEIPCRVVDGVGIVIDAGDHEHRGEPGSVYEADGSMRKTPIPKKDEFSRYN